MTERPDQAPPEADPLTGLLRQLSEPAATTSPRFMTAREAQQLLEGKVALSSLYELAHRGAFKVKRVGRKVLFDREDFLAYLSRGWAKAEAKATEASPPPPVKKFKYRFTL
jgi:excisionase family DNA binding protein